MADSFLKSVRAFFEGNLSVRKVADDPALTAELLLLFRMILADGEVTEAEMATFRRICSASFGIAEEDIGQVMEYLQDYGYETTGRQAIDTFREMDRERRVELMRHLIEMARADAHLSLEEVGLAKKIAAMLELDAKTG